MVVVDDNEDAAESLARLIEVMGYSARFVTDAEHVLALVAAHRPHVVFLDLGMPGIDGFEICRRVRRKFGFQDLWVVALTGYGSEEDRARSRRAGFDAHLLKPPSPELVRSTLEELCKPRGRPADQ